MESPEQNPDPGIRKALHPLRVPEGRRHAAWGASPKSISVAQRRISEIVHGKRSVSADSALRLGRFFGMEAQFWLNLQSRYDLQRAEIELDERLDKEVKPHAA